MEPQAPWCYEPDLSQKLPGFTAGTYSMITYHLRLLRGRTWVLTRDDDRTPLQTYRNATLNAALVVMGDRLGLYRALADIGPGGTPPEATTPAPASAAAARCSVSQPLVPSTPPMSKNTWVGGFIAAPSLAGRSGRGRVSLSYYGSDER